MIRPLPSLVRSWILLLTLLFVSVANSFGQQPDLKKQAIDPYQPVTGHNNLRKLSKIYDQQGRSSKGKLRSVADDAQDRRQYELQLLKDPFTGRIPEGIREKELAFARQLLSTSASGRSNGRVISDWKPRGPYNVGGRTRALAIDLEDEDVILAGGVSGGMWRSEDGGLTWSRTTGSNELKSVTAIAQDPRPGFRNIWYYTTGERIGNSASATGAFFSGNGVFKSTDGGKTWNVLSSIADNQPQLNSRYDVIFNIAIHPTTGDVYLATFLGVHRSTDGGATFTEVLAGTRDSQSDILITPSGILYASFNSGAAPNRGIFRSTDGVTWTPITPTGFPATRATAWGRIVLGYTPSNENIVYAYADNGLGNGGAYLWRYTHDATTPTWTNLSANLPAFGGAVGNLNTQGSYNMLIKVHPNDPNVIFLGATNLYRSTNGFTARTGTSWIGGYSPANDVSIYPNQHPDHHVLVFYPSNPLRALSATDGGVHYTDNILANNAGILPVLWDSRNNGYLTTQPYAVSLVPTGSSDNIMAGFQDNGTWFTNSTNLTAPWSEEFGGDGSYNLFADGGITRYVSSQRGNIYRLNYTDPNAPSGDYVSFTRVTPAGASGFAFIAPFVLDPNNDNVMYLPAGNRIWRNDNLDGIPLFSNAPTPVNWSSLANSQVPAGNTITALTVSRVPANRLYYGTNTGLIYRVDNANIGDQTKTDISTGKGLPPGNVICVTTDPTNADRVFVVFSNYNIPSIFYSENGGGTWTDISGNLEQNSSGTGNGPSARWLAIEGNNDRYYVGTSTGLYSTTTISGTSTTWTQEDPNGIGNVVVPMVRTRDDGFVALASHGNGLYSGKFEVTPLPEQTLTVINPIDDFEVFVNSPPTIIDVSNVFSNTDGGPITFSLINTNPSLITATLQENLLVLSYAPNAIGKGAIGVVATSGGESVSEAFNVTVRDIEYVLYDQNLLSNGTRPSQQFTDFGNLIAQSADDFEIPSGQTWSLESVFAPGAVNGTPVLNAAIVEIYSDSIGGPNQLIYNSGVIAPVGGSSDLTLNFPSPVSLSTGKYWISVYVRLAFGAGNQWFWRTTATINGVQAQFKDAGDLFGTGATDWSEMSTVFGGAPVDMVYTLFGKGSGIPAPSAPSDLEVLFSTNTKFDLAWADNSENELGFVIERSTTGTNFTHRATVGPDVDAYSDTDFFDPSLTYYYRVAAIGINDTSAYSNVDSTAIVPKAPVAKPATLVFPTFFVANWDSVEGAKYYELDVSSDNFQTFLTGYNAKIVSGNSHLVKGTSPSLEYQYRLRAGNAGGESDNSNAITVASVKRLKLAAVCSTDPRSTRRWKVTNPNLYPVAVKWVLLGTSQEGTFDAPPGDSFFSTNTVRGINTAIISWRDDKYIPYIAARTSTTERCTAATEAAFGQNGFEDTQIDTEIPFIIDVWPNPSTDKFNVMISSPVDSEVELEIFGLKGERHLTTKAQSNMVVEIDAQNYTPGVYILKAQQMMRKKSIKLIKE
jgi:photosystem II stability/assembly factor-like uncharacterized protein